MSIGTTTPTDNRQRYLSGVVNIFDFALDQFRATGNVPNPYDPAVDVGGVKSTIRTEGQEEKIPASGPRMFLNFALIVVGVLGIVLIWRKIA